MHDFQVLYGSPSRLLIWVLIGSLPKLGQGELLECSRGQHGRGGPWGEESRGPRRSLLFVVRGLPREWEATFGQTQLFFKLIFSFQFIWLYKMTFKVTDFPPDPSFFFPPFCSSWRAHQSFKDEWKALQGSSDVPSMTYSFNSGFLLGA